MFKKKKYIISAIIILVVLGYLGFTALSHSTTYYYTVDEVLAENAGYGDESVKINGLVVPGSFKENTTTHEFTFTMAGETQQISVIYSGVIPDAFKEDNDVVVEGRFNQDGTFGATEIIVKCPSRYVAEE